MLKTQSRRNFLKQSGTALSGSWVTLNMPVILAAAQTACSRQQSESPFIILNAAEAVGFGAIADQIIPPGETPGATDIGVIYFLDEALNGFLAHQAQMLKDGLSDLDNAAGAQHADAANFAELSFDDQTALLNKNENTAMFETMIRITRLGLFALPEYGGNKDYAGWKLIGFDHRHAWQPPFGYYDELYTAGEGDHAEP